jgi:thiamine-monophosphate kinase
MSHDDQSAGDTLNDLGESGLLTEVFARLRGGGPDVLVGPGDDTALLATRGAVLATTDTMVRGRDWRDEWSTASDVGTKVVVQNLADLAAMGGVGTGLLVTLVAPGDTAVAWVRELTEGIAGAADRAGVPVIGGDLSSSVDAVMVSVTALGELPGPGPVLRSGAAPGQVVAVSGTLGWSAAGLEVLRRADTGWWPAKDAAQSAARYVGYHCRPEPDLSQGPRAAEAGATAMIDLSDGLARDGGRIAEASGVRIDLDVDELARHARQIGQVLDAATALDCVLTGGEEHTLLATFAPSDVPSGWAVVGEVTAPAGRSGAGVWWRGERVAAGGWDHYGG